MALDDDLTTLETTTAGIAQDVTAAVAEIADLKKQVAGGGATPAQLARLKTLEDNLAAVDAALKAGQ